MKSTTKEISDCVAEDLSAEKILCMIAMASYIHENKCVPSENDIMLILKNKVSRKMAKESIDYAVKTGWVGVVGSVATFQPQNGSGAALERPQSHASSPAHTVAGARLDSASESSPVAVLPSRDSEPPSEVTDDQIIIWARWLCRELAINVKNQYKRNGAKVPSNFLATERNKAAWISDMERIIRIDKRSPKEIFDLMKWIDADNFWSVNILSPSKLREKYDNLILRSKAGKRKEFKSRSNHTYEDPAQLARERGLL